MTDKIIELVILFFLVAALIEPFFSSVDTLGDAIAGDNDTSSLASIVSVVKIVLVLAVVVGAVYMVRGRKKKGSGI